MNFFTANIVDDDEESSTTSPIVRTDNLFRGVQDEIEVENARISTPQLYQKGEGLDLVYDGRLWLITLEIQAELVS